MANTYFGIDLGTGNCSVAYVVDDPRTRHQPTVRADVVPIPVNDGDVAESGRMPSVLAADWTTTRRRKPLFGWSFFNAFRTPRRNAPLLQRGVDYFTSVKSDMGTFRVYPFSKVPNVRTPGEATAEILRRLTEVVRGHNSRHDLCSANVALTVPASFSSLARKETLAAAEQAGFDPQKIELIDEPVAALVDLLNDSQATDLLTDRYRNVLVFDYGAGTCDLSLVKARFNAAAENGLDVINLAISPYTRLGGDDIDRAVMQQIVWPDIVRAVGEGTFSSQERRLIHDTLLPTVARGLKEAVCRSVSRDLSEGKTWAAILKGRPVTVPLPSQFRIERLGWKTPKQFEMSPVQFEDVMRPFTDVRETREELGESSLLRPVLETLERAELTPEDLDVLLLHGGSSLNPFVERMLQNQIGRAGHLFGHLQIARTPGPLTSVAKGAALAAYWRHARKHEFVRPIVSEDLGVILLGGGTRCLVSAGQPLPFPDADAIEDVTAMGEPLVVPADGLPELLVPVYTGSPDNLSGVVKVPLPTRTSAGAQVRIKLRVDHEKRLEWWFGVGGVDFQKADSVADPWTTHAPSPPERAVMDHRRGLRARMDAGVSPTFVELVREVVLLRKAGEIDQALAAVEDLISRFEGRGELANLKGLLLAESGDSAGALAAFGDAARQNPREAVMVGNYGAQLADEGRWAEAKAALRRALALNPNLTYVYQYLADALRQEGDEQGAERELRQAAALAQQQVDGNPLESEHWWTLARIRQLLGEYEFAREAIRAASELDRNNRFGGDSAAVIATEHGRRKWQKDHTDD